jgi:hypothetical protein
VERDHRRRRQRRRRHQNRNHRYRHRPEPSRISRPVPHAAPRLSQGRSQLHQQQSDRGPQLRGAR